MITSPASTLSPSAVYIFSTIPPWGRLDIVLHFHGLNNSESVPCIHLVALTDLELHNHALYCGLNSTLNIHWFGFRLLNGYVARGNHLDLELVTINLNMEDCWHFTLQGVAPLPGAPPQFHPQEFRCNGRVEGEGQYILLLLYYAHLFTPPSALLILGFEYVCGLAIYGFLMPKGRL